jgi:hypothetical protein
VISATFTPRAIRIPQESICLRAFSSVPAWAVVHAVRDDSTAPLVCEGEVVVVESNGRLGHIPEDGGLYLIEYATPRQSPDFGHERRTREIVLTSQKANGWYADPYACAMGRSRKVLMSDGPYGDITYLAQKIVGRVVGVYRPSQPICRELK